MKRYILKFIPGLLIIAFTFQSAMAQPVARIGYFLDNSTHKHLLNPALVPHRGYLAYPGVGAFSLGFDSNLKLSTFLYPAETAGDPLLTFLHPDVTSEQFLSQLQPNNNLDMTTRISIASMGFYAGSSFWTAELATRIKGGMNLPLGLFDFMKNGMASPSGSSYDLDNLTVGMEAMAEASLGTSIRITKNFRLGVKGKYLIGLAKMTGGLDQMNISMMPDEWSVSSQGLISMYAPKSVEFRTDADNYIDLGNGMPVLYDQAVLTQPNLDNFPGQGFAFDAGFHWAPFSFLQISAGITDMGSITWKNSSLQTYKSSGSVSFSGLEGLGAEETSTEDEIPDFAGMIMDMAKFKKQGSSSGDDLVQELVPTVNAGVELGVLRNKLSVGVLYTNHMIQDNNQTEITGMLNLKPGKGLNLAASYSLTNNTVSTLGLAFGLNLGLANIFIACDRIPLDVTPPLNIEGIPIGIPLPIHTLSTNIQAGVSLSLGKMRIKK
jgi:hypothetical protein